MAINPLIPNFQQICVTQKYVGLVLNFVGLNLFQEAQKYTYIFIVSFLNTELM